MPRHMAGRRLLSAVGCLSLAVAVFAGCGSDKKDSAAPSSGSAKVEKGKAGSAAVSASSKKAPGCHFPAAPGFYFVFGTAVAHPATKIKGIPIQYGYFNNTNKSVKDTFTLDSATTVGYSVTAGVGGEVGGVVAKVSTHLDSTISAEKSSGGSVAHPVTVPPHKRPYGYWAMPTKTMSYHTYTIYADCTINKDYGMRTITWLTGREMRPYIGYTSS